MPFTLHALHLLHQLKYHLFVSDLILVPLVEFVSDSVTDFVVDAEPDERGVAEVEVSECAQEEQLLD